MPASPMIAPRTVAVQMPTCNPPADIRDTPFLRSDWQTALENMDLAVSGVWNTVCTIGSDVDAENSPFRRFPPSEVDSAR